MQRFTALALQAQAQLRDGRLEASFDTARRAEAISRGNQECDVFFVAVHGHAAVAAVYLALWRRARASSDGRAAGLEPRELRRRALRASRRLGQFARLYPAARPCADFFAAAWLELSARGERAASRAARSREDARRMNLPFDEWRALRCLGRVTPPAEQAEHRRAAQELGARLGLPREADEVTGDAMDAMDAGRLHAI
jgi:hypothetical protein